MYLSSSLSYVVTTLTLLLAAATTTTTAESSPDTQTITIHARPVAENPPAFTPLATISYSLSPPHTGKLISLTPPPNNTEYTTVAIIEPSSPDPIIRSTLIRTPYFHPPFSAGAHFRLHLSSPPSTVLSAAWIPFPHPHLKEGEVEVIPAVEGRGPILDKDPPKQGAAAGGAGGVLGGLGVGAPDQVNEDGEVVEEKTFLQKYWWVLAAALVVSMIGPGEK